MFPLVLALTMTLSVSPDLVADPETTVKPVSLEAYSWDLQEEGFKNGQLPDTRLIEVDGCLLERDAAYTMSVMIEAAAADGVRLDPGSCYRTIEQQKRTYDKNCPVTVIETPVMDPATGEPLLDDDGEPVMSRSTRRECTLPTATPSRSNHGWGRAVDFEVRGRTMLCGDAGFRWLQENAAQYGWIHPDWAHCGEPLEEPWHWEYGGLQLIPLESRVPSEVVFPAGVE